MLDARRAARADGYWSGIIIGTLVGFVLAHIAVALRWWL